MERSGSELRVERSAYTNYRTEDRKTGWSSRTSLQRVGGLLSVAYPWRTEIAES